MWVSGPDDRARWQPRHRPATRGPRRRPHRSPLSSSSAAWRSGEVSGRGSAEGLANTSPTHANFGSMGGVPRSRRRGGAWRSNGSELEPPLSERSRGTRPEENSEDSPSWARCAARQQYSFQSGAPPGLGPQRSRPHLLLWNRSPTWLSQDEGGSPSPLRDTVYFLTKSSLKHNSRPSPSGPRHSHSPEGCTPGG